MISDELKRARRYGVPLVAISTADQQTATDAIAKLEPEAPVVLWDVARGFQGLNPLGTRAIQDLGVDALTTNPYEALAAAVRLTAGGILIVQNAPRYFDDAGVVQAIMNLREAYKAPPARMLIMLGAAFTLPPELVPDVLCLDEPLPDDAQITAIVSELAQCAELEIADEDKARATDALRGLAAFSVEQAAALSMRKSGIDLAGLWDRKRKMLEQVKGLSMERPGATFDDIGGQIQAKQFAADLFGGPAAPRLIVFIDEIEKAMAGAGGSLGDSSGVSQDSLGVLLSEMEDREYTGQINLGPPGSGKTQLARALASTYGRPCLRLDLGAAKGSLVGQSEQSIRAAMKTILAMAGHGGAYFVATCNGIDSIKPELRRRFSFGLWFFDLPDAEEREAIGTVLAKRWSIDGAGAFFRACEGWSGANIRDCLKLSAAMRIDLTKASGYVVPAATQDPQGLERLRSAATGRYLSASYPGTYRGPSANVPGAGRRSITVED